MRTGQSKRSNHFQRILPIVGQGFMKKRIALMGADFCCLAAEAFARSGVRRMIATDNHPVSALSAMPGTLGNDCISRGAADALFNAFRQHNRLERHWELECMPMGLHRGSLDGIDLILAGGDAITCLKALRLSEREGIPAVAFTLLREGLMRSAVFVSAPGLPSLQKLFFSIAEQQFCSYEPARRLDWLDASDMAMAAAKALLLRGTEYERQDFENLLFSQQRIVILRGTAEWPWTVAYANPDADAAWIKKVAGERGQQEELLSRQALGKERVMVIGVGTASLFAGEAANWFRNLLMVDCKNYSEFNPVRQLPGTSFIGMPKPFAVRDAIRQRVCTNNSHWTESRFNGVRTVMHHNGFSISGCSLEVSEENEEKLAELIRWYNPTLAVVGMGRSGAAEPNFIAANLLRKAGIRHIVPSAFPSAAAYKMIVVDGASGACYGCIQHKLVIDAGNAPTLTNAQQRMFYGGVQPATVFETYPSVHCLLRLCIELCSSGRRIWFSELLAQEKNCLVGCNRAEQKDGGWVYGVSMPGQVVAYGTADLAGTREFTQCPSCGRSYSVRHKMEV